ncbi:UNVERIFIED_CONTAM: hypothetical protein FKN15_027533 [Acipenser sinensis]
MLRLNVKRWHFPRNVISSVCCRSAVMEERLFWQFEGSMVGLTFVFAFLVVVRQRALDRLASEKVRKQIESI